MQNELIYIYIYELQIECIPRMTCASKCMRNVLIIPSFSAFVTEVKKKMKFINPLDWNRRHLGNNVNDKLRQALSPSVTWIEFKFLNYVFSSFGRCLHSIEQTSK